MGVNGFGSLTMMQRTLATLCNGIALKASMASLPSSSFVIHAVDEDFLDIGHWVAEICDGSPSPDLFLSSSASVLRLNSQSIGCPTNVECEFDN